MTLKGAYAGIITGGITVLIWKHFAWFGLYEIVPGFLFSLIAIYIASTFDKKPSASMQNHFDEVVKLSKY